MTRSVARQSRIYHMEEGDCRWSVEKEKRIMILGFGISYESVDVGSELENQKV